MKKLITILLIFICGVTFGQNVPIPTYDTTFTPTADGYQLGRIMWLKPLSLTLPLVAVGDSGVSCPTCVTAASSLTANQLVIGGGSKAVSILAAGTSSQILHGGTPPTWKDTTAVGAGGITGSGTSGQMTYWNGTSTVTGSANLLYTDAATTGSGLTITDNSLTTGKIGDISSTSISSGSLLSLTTVGTAAASNSQTALFISLTGTNATSGQKTYGMRVLNDHAGTGSNNGAYFEASGGTTNYAIVTGGGSVGIGTQTPSTLLDVQGGTINGNISSGTSAILQLQHGGTKVSDFSIPSSNQTIFRLFSETAGNTSGSFYHDGPDASNSAYGAFGCTTSGTWFGVANGVIFSSSKNGSGTQLPMRFGGYSGSWTEWMTISTGGDISVGTTTASARLSIIKTTEQLRVGYDASNYYSTTIGSTGGVTLDAVGSGSAFTFSDAVTVPAFTATGAISVTDGANKNVGVATLVSGTVTVNNTRVTANSRIFLTGVDGAGVSTDGELSLGTIVAGTSFVINSSLLTDVRVVQWFIIN